MPGGPFGAGDRRKPAGAPFNRGNERIGKDCTMTRTLIAAALLAACFAAPALAEGERMTREQWQQLSPEEKEARKQAARERWQAMSPAEKQAAKARRREHFDNLPPEEQERIKQRIAERRAAKQPQQQ